MQVRFPMVSAGMGKPGHDVACRGHRQGPQQSFSGAVVSVLEGRGGSFGRYRREHLGTRGDVESFDERGESGGVEAMHRSAGRGELRQVTAPRGEVEIVPVDEPFHRTVAVNAEAGEDPTDADIDAGHPQSAVGAAVESEVGHPGHAVSVEVDDLRVEHVTTEQQLAGIECDRPPVGFHRPESGIGSERDGVVVVTGEIAEFERSRSPMADHDSRDRGMLPTAVEGSDQIGDAPDPDPLGIDHRPAALGSEPSHRSSLPSATWSSGVAGVGTRRGAAR